MGKVLPAFVLLMNLVFSLSNGGSPVDCDFETPTLCGYEQVQGTGDQFDWLQREGTTPTAGTGPLTDHTTGNGHYVYIETSAPRVTGDKAILLTPILNWTSSLTCLTFWYNMYGGSMGTLEVFIAAPDLNTSFHTVWSKAGDQGQYWQQAKVIVDTSSPVRFAFSGTRGDNYYSDMAIDDVTATEGNCGQVDCNFEGNTLCGWTNVQEGTDQLDWTVQQGLDHTTGSLSGTFVTIDTGTGSVGHGDAAMLISPVHPPVSHPFCLRFWYRLDGGTGDMLDVFLVDSASQRGVVKWSLAGHQPTGWHEAAVPIFYTETFQIAIRGTESGGSGKLAVDDIVFVENYNCQQSPDGSWPNSSEHITLSPLSASETTDVEITESRVTQQATFPATQAGHTPHDFPRTVDVRLFTSCDFETDCHYTNGPGDFAWTVRSSHTTTTGTGPDTDHTRATHYGHYGYTEASNHVGKKAMLLTAELPATSDNMCLQFWYHMYGRGIGTLNVKLAYNSSVLDKPLWSLSGDQGNQWHFGQVALPNTDLTRDFKIAFEGEVLSGTALEVYGDIAVDDIETVPKECPTDGDCSFEVLCTSWANVDHTRQPILSDNTNWGLGHYGHSPSGGPDDDHTFNNTKGTFLYFSPPSGFLHDTAVLISDPFEHSRHRCVSFWFYLSSGTASLSVGQYFHTLNTVIWDSQQHRASIGQWIQAHADIPSLSSYQIVFVASNNNGLGVVALDDITFSSTSCASATGTKTTNVTPPVVPYSYISTVTPEPTTATTISTTTITTTTEPTTTTTPNPEPTTTTATSTAEPTTTATITTPESTTSTATPVPTTASTTAEPTTTTTSTPEPTTITTTPESTSSPATTALSPTTSATPATKTTKPTTPISVPLTSSSAPYTGLFSYCDFESMSLWCPSYVTGPGHFPWTTAPGSTAAGLTRPAVDHSTLTHFGHYSYIESSQHAGQTATLLTGLFPPSSTDICLDFYYYMSGGGAGTLNTKLAHGTTVLDRVLWTKSGDQGDQWQRAQVNIPASELSEMFRIAFEGVVPGYVSPWDPSYLAIDDIMTSPHPCIP